MKVIAMKRGHVFVELTAEEVALLARADLGRATITGQSECEGLLVFVSGPKRVEAK